MSTPSADMPPGPTDSEDDVHGVPVRWRQSLSGRRVTNNSCDGHSRRWPRRSAPGMGEAWCSLRQGLRTAGASTFVVL